MVLKSEKIFESMKPFLDSKREELTKRVNAVYAFEVLPAKGKKVEKIWTVDLKKGLKLSKLKVISWKEDKEPSMLLSS